MTKAKRKPSRRVLPANGCQGNGTLMWSHIVRTFGYPPEILRRALTGRKPSDRRRDASEPPDLCRRTLSAAHRGVMVGAMTAVRDGDDEAVAFFLMRAQELFGELLKSTTASSPSDGGFVVEYSDEPLP